MVKPIRDRAGAHEPLSMFRGASGRCETAYEYCIAEVIRPVHTLTFTDQTRIPVRRFGETIEPRFIPNESGGVVDVMLRKSLVIWV